MTVKYLTSEKKWNINFKSHSVITVNSDIYYLKKKCLEFDYFCHIADTTSIWKIIYVREDRTLNNDWSATNRLRYDAIFLLDFGYTLRKPVRCDWDKLHICNSTYKETTCWAVNL